MSTTESVRFDGFKPSDFTKNYLKNKLALLLEEAPYGSALEAVYCRVNGSYTGLIKICASRGRRFIASDSARDLCRLNQRLIDRISNQLRQWKSLRFISELNARGEYGESNSA